MNAAQRLQKALATTDRGQFVFSAKRCGMNPREVGTAYAGYPVSALAYMRLCALRGIDPQTGAPAAIPFARDIDWAAFGAAVKAWRKTNKTSYRAASHYAGVRKSTLSTAGRAQAVNTESFLATCRLIGSRPEQFLITGAVSREHRLGHLPRRRRGHEAPDARTAA